MALLENKRDLVAPPNLVTYLRLAAVIPICMLLLQPGAAGWWAFGLFAFAAGTDKLDGWLAKRNNGHWITNWGKFLDPIVDKVLVVAILGRAVYLAQGALREHLVIVLSGIVLRELVVGLVKSRQLLRSAAEAGRFSMLVQSAAVALLALPTISGWTWQTQFSILVLYGALGASLCSGWLYVVEWWGLRTGRTYDPAMAGYTFVTASFVIAVSLPVVLREFSTLTLGVLVAALASCLCVAWVVWTYLRAGKPRR